jgi:hypothetical protein
MSVTVMDEPDDERRARWKRHNPNRCSGSLGH